MCKFNEDFDFFWKKIESNENFVFSRYADGEVLLMKGFEVGENTQAFNVDKWKAPNKLTKVGIDLLKTLNHIEDNYYYAIPGVNDNIEDYNFLKNKIISNNLTFVNLWINNNYNKTKNKLNNLNRDVILICNEKANSENFPFKINEIIKFPDDCITFWENNDISFLKILKNNIENKNNKLFFISCGPISEIIIDYLYTINPNNTYIDLGSSLDEFIYGYKTRPYMVTNSYYSNLISNF